MSTYTFDEGFRLKIIAVCLDNQWMAKYGVVIKPEYFDLYKEMAVVEAILDYREQYKKSPTDDADLRAMAAGKYKKFVNQDEIDAYIQTVFDAQELDLEYAKEAAIEFARGAATKLAILEAVDGAGADGANIDVEKAIEKLRDALNIGKDIHDVGILFQDTKSWMYEPKDVKITTGWSPVDDILGGGLAGGELGVILGPSNRGKSMALINIGAAIAKHRNRRVLLHFSHEMRAAQVARRYYANLLGRFPDFDNAESYEEELLDYVDAEDIGEIRIVSGRKNTSEIISICEQVISDGKKIGAIIDDYLDLVQLVGHPELRELRHKLSYLYQWYRELGEEYDVPVWTASQSNRDSYDTEIVRLKNMAEDMGKVSIADVVMALCQTREEKDANRCRLFMAKVRDGGSEDIIDANYCGYSQRIEAIRKV